MDNSNSDSGLHHTVNEPIIKKNSYNKIKSQKLMEKYNQKNFEMNYLNKNLNPSIFITSEPINPFIVFIWLSVIVIIIFLFVEYINKQKK